MTALLEAALEYAAHGFPVFPVGAGKDGKAPRVPNGFHDATRDPERIRAWWTRWPNAGIGVPTGAVTGSFLLDVDPRHGGAASLAGLLEQHGLFPEGPVALTGGGGYHYWFAHPGGYVGNTTGSRPGLDTRGDDGYVVVPPSPHRSGTPYAWSRPLLGAKLPLIPSWLFKIVTEHQAAPPKGPFVPVTIPPTADDAAILERVFTGPNGLLHRYVYENHLSKEHTEDHAAYVAICTALYLAGAREEQVPRILRFDEGSWVKFGLAMYRQLVRKRGYYRRRATLIRVSSLYKEADDARNPGNKSATGVFPVLHDPANCPVPHHPIATRMDLGSGPETLFDSDGLVVDGHGHVQLDTEGLHWVEGTEYRTPGSGTDDELASLGFSRPAALVSEAKEPEAEAEEVGTLGEPILGESGPFTELLMPDEIA